MDEWDYYQECHAAISSAKSTRLIDTCTFFELLTKCQCQIAELMRNREFKRNFRYSNLNVFSKYTKDIREAFKRAQSRYRSVLKQEDVINEAVYYGLSDMVVMKVARYAINCEICEMRKHRIHASPARSNSNVS